MLVTFGAGLVLGNVVVGFVLTAGASVGVLGLSAGGSTTGGSTGGGVVVVGGAVTTTGGVGGGGA